MSIERELESDLDWRSAELATLRLHVSAGSVGSVGERAALRALWTMLYAHYEGFCKFALELYLDAVERVGITRREAIEELAMYSMEREFKILKNKFDRRACWHFYVDGLPKALSNRLEFSERPEIKSNLWPRLLREQCADVALNISVLSEHERKLTTLVARRNEIAHGQKNVIQSLDEYKTYHDAVWDVMYALALDITAAVSEARFRK